MSRKTSEDTSKSRLTFSRSCNILFQGCNKNFQARPVSSPKLVFYFIVMIFGFSLVIYKLDSLQDEIARVKCNCDFPKVDKNAETNHKIEQILSAEFPRLRNIIYDQGHLIVSTVNKTVSTFLMNTKKYESSIQNPVENKKFATIAERVRYLSSIFFDQIKWLKHPGLVIGRDDKGFLIRRMENRTELGRFSAIAKTELPESIVLNIKVRFPVKGQADFPFGLVTQKGLDFLKKNSYSDNDWKKTMPILFHGTDTLFMLGKHSLEDCPQTDEETRTCVLTLSMRGTRDFRIYNDQKSINLVNKIQLSPDTKYYLIFEVPNPKVVFWIYQPK